MNSNPLVYSRLRIKSYRYFIDFMDTEAGLSEAKKYRKNNIEFKFCKITRVEQDHPFKHPMGKLFRRGN